MSKIQTNQSMQLGNVYGDLSFEASVRERRKQLFIHTAWEKLLALARQQCLLIMSVSKVCQDIKYLDESSEVKLHRNM